MFTSFTSIHPRAFELTSKSQGLHRNRRSHSLRLHPPRQGRLLIRHHRRRPLVLCRDRSRYSRRLLRNSPPAPPHDHARSRLRVIRQQILRRNKRQPLRRVQAQKPQQRALLAQPGRGGRNETAGSRARSWQRVRHSDVRVAR